MKNHSSIKTLEVYGMTSRIVKQTVCLAFDCNKLHKRQQAEDKYVTYKRSFSLSSTQNLTHLARERTERLKPQQYRTNIPF